MMGEVLGKESIPIVTEGQCPHCFSIMKYVDQNLWQCSNGDCANLIGLCKMDEDIEEWGCQTCNIGHWGIAKASERYRTCPTCKETCVRIVEPNRQE